MSPKNAVNGEKPSSPSDSKSSNDVVRGSATYRKLDHKAILYMALLAVQFGVQPILTRKYTSPHVIRSTVVLIQEMIKFIIAFTMLYLSSPSSQVVRDIWKDWTVRCWLKVAMVPAGLYAVQNVAALQAYQTLDAVTFNVLNQTKTLSAALCCYWVMGRKQSMTQVAALLLLLVSALVMEKVVTVDSVLGFFFKGSSSSSPSSGTQDDDIIEVGRTRWEARHFTHGVVPVMTASLISGLAGALSQRNLQQSNTTTTTNCDGSINKGGRNPYLFSMELCAASCLVLLVGWVSFLPDGKQIQRDGFWKGWTWQTLIPIVTNSCGGIVVGLVTKYAGSVRKGFALIFGILLSGILQALLVPDQSITREEIVGGLLAAVSLYMHAAHPPPSLSKSKQE